MALKLFSAQSVGSRSCVPREGGKRERSFFFLTQSGRVSAEEINAGKEHGWGLGAVWISQSQNSECGDGTIDII